VRGAHISFAPARSPGSLCSPTSPHRAEGKMKNQFSKSQRSAPRILSGAGCAVIRIPVPFSLGIPRARGTPGFSLPAALRGDCEKPHRLSHHGPPIASAFRARCVRLAPCSPPVDTGFLSTASARTRLQAGCHGLGLRRARHVLTPTAATAPRPARRDDREASLGEGRGERNIVLLRCRCQVRFGARRRRFIVASFPQANTAMVIARPRAATASRPAKTPPVFPQEGRR
jgi:hypothetical protein